MVGKAMMAGSKGMGGRRYQIAAVLLTYAAVSLAAIPVIIHHSEFPDGVMAVFGQLALYGIASPFLALQDPLHGLIGLVILFVGIRIAWQITAGKKITGILGPFSSSSPAST